MLMKNRAYFTRKIFYRFFWPTILSSMCLAFGNIVDSLVVGARMGETGLAAIGIVTPIYMIYNVFDVGISSGGAVRFARWMGEGKVDAAKRNFNSTLLASVALSLLFVLLGNLLLEPLLQLLGAGKATAEVYGYAKAYARVLICACPLFFLNFQLYYYVRSNDDQKRAAAGFAVGNTLDILLNILFVIVLDFGVVGAIWATVVGKTAAIIIYLPHFLKRDATLRIRPVKPDGKEIFFCFRTGFSSSSQYIFNFICMLVINNLLIRMRNGVLMVAVFDVLLNVTYIMLGIYDGMGDTVSPMAATFHGERNTSAKKLTLRMALLWGLLFGSILTALIAVFSGQIGAIFGVTDTVASQGALLRYACSILPAGVLITMIYYYQATARENMALLLNISRTFVCYLAFSVLFALLLPESEFWWVFAATELASLAVFGALLALRKLRARRKPEEKTGYFNNVIRGANDDIGTLCAQIEDFCSQWDASFKQSYYVTLTVEELCQAILQNAFTGRDDDYIEITLIALPEHGFELHIRDNAVKFNPFEMDTKKISGNDEDEHMASIGILMVKKEAKQFNYRRYQGFNTLTIRI